MPGNVQGLGFLDSRQQSAIEAFRVIDQRLDALISGPDDVIEGLEDVVPAIIGAQTGSLLLLRDEEAHKQGYSNPEERGNSLRADGRAAITNNLLLTIVVKQVICLTGEEEATNDIDLGSLDGYTFGHDLIRWRAGFAIGHVLSGVDLLAMPTLDSDNGVSVFQRCDDAHVKAGNVTIATGNSPDDTNKLAELIDRQRENVQAVGSYAPDPPIKLGGTAVDLADNVTDYVEDAVTEFSEELSELQNVRVTIEASLRPDRVLSISDDEVTLAARTARNLVEYLRVSSALDPSIAADPRTQFLDLLMTNVQGFDVVGELDLFDKTVAGVSAKQKQLWAAEGSNQTS
jgi:hypothetical protein